MVKKLKKAALDLIYAYESFLDYKIKEDAMLFSNIMEGLNLLYTQSELHAIVIFCGPMHYSALLNTLKKESRLSKHGIKLRKINLFPLLSKMKPFMHKNKVMQSNYEIALNILKRKKPERFNVHSAEPSVMYSTLGLTAL